VTPHPGSKPLYPPSFQYFSIQPQKSPGIGLLEGFNTIFSISSTFCDKEPPGQKVIRPIQLDQDIYPVKCCFAASLREFNGVNLIRGTNPGHFGNVSQCGRVQVVVPCHVNHHRPLGEDWSIWLVWFAWFVSHVSSLLPPFRFPFIPNPFVPSPSGVSLVLSSQDQPS